MTFRFERMKKVASGKEKDVFEHPTDTKKLVAKFKDTAEKVVAESPGQMKGRFYLTKILHSLFPETIPDVHMAVRDGDSYFVSEKKELDHEHVAYNELLMKMEELTKSQEASPPGLRGEYLSRRDKQKEKLRGDPQYADLKKVLLHLGVRVDPSAPNYGYDPVGNLVYVDNTFFPWRPDRNGNMVRGYDPERLRDAIAHIPEEEVRKRTVSFFERLEVLYAEEEKARSLD